MMSPKRSLLFALLLIFVTLAQAQKKFTSDKGEVSFTSNAILELINASSKSIKGIVDPATGSFAFVVTIRSFEGFNSSLQREHFNEKYMETDKFYDATFSGKIIEPVDFTKDGTYAVQAKGNFVVHGKKQPRVIPGKIQLEKGILKITSDFTVLLADHDIKVPQILSEKIATEIYVKLNVALSQK